MSFFFSMSNPHTRLVGLVTAGYDWKGIHHFKFTTRPQKENLTSLPSIASCLLRVVVRPPHTHSKTVSSTVHLKIGCELKWRPVHAYTHNAPGPSTGFVLPGKSAPSTSTKVTSIIHLIFIKICSAPQPSLLLICLVTCKALIKQDFLQANRHILLSLT